MMDALSLVIIFVMGMAVGTLITIWVVVNAINKILDRIDKEIEELKKELE